MSSNKGSGDKTPRQSRQSPSNRQKKQQRNQNQRVQRSNTQQRTQNSSTQAGQSNRGRGNISTQQQQQRVQSNQQQQQRTQSNQQQQQQQHQISFLFYLQNFAAQLDFPHHSVSHVIQQAQLCHFFSVDNSLQQRQIQ